MKTYPRTAFFTNLSLPPGAAKAMINRVESRTQTKWDSAQDKDNLTKKNDKSFIAKMLAVILRDEGFRRNKTCHPNASNFHPIFVISSKRVTPKFKDIVRITRGSWLDIQIPSSTPEIVIQQVSGEVQEPGFLTSTYVMILI